ncbi:MAG: DUF2162 domain-containing protein [Methanobrevibacter sp.]|nr:DUF2162 domain-containing protein [Methanobrevibacter sp.]
MFSQNIIEMIIILFLFSFAIAISLKEYKLGRYKSFMLTIYFEILLVLSLFISNIYENTVISVINNYLNISMILIGMMLVFNGFIFIKEFKNKSSNKKTKLKLSKVKLLVKNNISIIILLTCSYFGVLINIIYLAPSIWFPIFDLGIVLAFFSFILIVVIYSFLNNFIQTKKTYGFIGKFLILMGLYFLAIYAFVPNFQIALSSSMNPLDLPINNMLIYILAIGIICFISGFIIKRSKKFKNLI